MSSICGILPYQGNKVFKDDIILMLDLLTYCGLERTDFWRDDVVTLGQQSFDVTAESFQETFPLNNIGINLTVVADIRLDNRAELFQKLAIPSIDQNNYGDGQLLLASYRKWGENCVDHLLGDFAFAIWDKNQRKLFLGRDHLGNNPLFYYTDGKRFIFASEPKAIVAASGVENRINKNKLITLVIPQANSLFSEETWFENIFPIVPATCLTVDINGIVKKRTFWQPQIEKELSFKNEQEIFEAFRDLMFEAVNDRLRSKFPVTALLSGGLDSSAIVSVAANILEKQNKQLHTLSVVLPDEKDKHLEDERNYINQFQKFKNVSINYVSDPERGPFDNIDELVRGYDTPNISSRNYLYSAFAEHAKKNNSRVILDGVGGELGATFYGTGCYAEMFFRFRWLRLWRELKLRKKLSGESLQYNLRANVIQPLVPDFIYKMRHPQTLENFIPVKDFPTQDNFAKKQIEHIAPRLGEFSNSPTRFSPFHRVNQIKDISIAQADNSSGVFGFLGSKSIEYRFPLMDKRLLEFCLAVPYDLKIKNGYQRYIIRAGLDKILPPKIQWRTSKTPFSPDYFRRYKAQRPQVLDFLAGIRLSDPIREIVDVERLKASAELPVEDDAAHTFAGQVARDFVPWGIYLIYFLRRFPEFQN